MTCGGGGGCAGGRGAVLSAVLSVVLVILSLPHSSRAHEDEGEDCPYGNRTLENGQVAISIAECCLQLVCCNGTIQRSYVDYEHPTRHLDENPCHHHHHPPAESRHHHPSHDHRKCCEWDEKVYADGHLLNDTCWQLKCHMGHWDFNDLIHEDCGHCSVYNDPHFITFDGYPYDWQGRCNYSLAQKGRHEEPPFGVFAKFRPCNDLPSCVDTAVFKNDKHTAIELDYEDVFTVLVNGEEFTVTGNHGLTQLVTKDGYHEVLAFRFKYRAGDECTVLIGSSGLVVMQCRFRIDIWAAPHLLKKLGGLCGNFSYDQKDDFTKRNGKEMPLKYNPYEFPLSWLTDEQELGSTCSTSCPEPFITKCGKDGGLSKDECTNTTKFEKLCSKKIINRDPRLMRACQYDLCWVTISAKDKGKVASKRRKNWLKTVIKPNYLLTAKLNATTD